MRSLTYFALVSLVLAVAWTNLVRVQAPAVTPSGPGSVPVPVTDPGPDPGPELVVAAADDDPEDIGQARGEPTPVSAQASASVILVPAVDPTGADDPGQTVPIPPVVDRVAEDTAEVAQIEHGKEPKPITEPEPHPALDVAEAARPGHEPDAIVSDGAVPAETSIVESPVLEDAAPAARKHELLGRVVDTAGDVVPNVQVHMTDLAGQLPTRLLLVDGEGAFVAQDVEPGRYGLAIAPRSLPKGLAKPAAVGVCRTGDDPVGFGSVCVELLATPDITTTELVLPFSSVIAGSVVDVDGKPVAGAIVRALAQVDRFRAVNEILRSDGIGRFALTLVPGPYEIQVLVPGGGGAPDRVSSRVVEAEEGTIYVLDAIVMAPPAAVITGSAPGADARSAVASEFVDAVTLEGRVVTRWGEPVEGIEVACVSRHGVEIDREISDATGTYVFADIPIGTFDVIAGATVPAGVPETAMPRLLSKPEPIAVDVRPTAPEAVVDDIVVEVERIFNVSGRVEIDPTALQLFKAQLLERDPLMMSLPEYRFRRAYLRGLRLSVRMIDARRGEARPVRIASDGTFTWSCALPAQDFAFFLEPRSERLGAAYPEPIVRPVSPSGVRTAEVVFECAPSDVSSVAAER